MRFPRQNDLFLLLMICMFPIHIWAMFIFFHEFPAYLMYLPPSEIIGILAYILSFALLESLLATGGLAFMSVFLPRRWFLNHFITQGFILVMVTAVWLIPVHFWSWKRAVGSAELAGDSQRAAAQIWLPAFLWSVSYLVAILGFTAAARHSNKVTFILQDLAERFIVPSMFFLVVDGVCIGVILIRNYL